MWLTVPCSKCSTSPPNQPEEWFIAFDLSEDIYKGTCHAGHEVVAILQALRYQVLYESGALAFLSGFHREAYSSCATALERFHEYAIEVFLHAAGVSTEAFQKSWSPVAKQSERQLGAFLFLYLQHTGRPYPVDVADYSKRRNKVIHEGQIPTREKARAFIREVFDMIESTDVILRTKYADAALAVRLRRYAEVKQLAAKAITPGEGPPYWTAAASAPSVMLDETKAAEPRDFEAALADLEGRMGIWGHGGNVWSKTVVGG